MNIHVRKQPLLIWAILLPLATGLLAGPAYGDEKPLTTVPDLERQLEQATASRDYDKALELAERIHEIIAPKHVDTLYRIASLHARMGEKETAYAWLEKAVDAGFWDAQSMLKDESFAKVKQERAFRAIAKRAWLNGYISMLVRDERDEFQKPDRVMATLAFSPGDQVADIGAGAGYFTIPIAKAVGPTGNVWAVDIEQAMLDHIEMRALAADLDNVRLHLVKADDPALEPHSLDTILMVDTLHYIDRRAEYATKLRRALKPNGRLVIIEYKPRSWEERPWGPPPEQQLARETVDAELAVAGFKPVKVHDFLPDAVLRGISRGSEGPGAVTLDPIVKQAVSRRRTPVHIRRVAVPVCLTLGVIGCVTIGGCSSRAKSPSYRYSQNVRAAVASLDSHRLIAASVMSEVESRMETFRGVHDLPGLTCGFVLPDGRVGAVGVGVSNKASARPMQPHDRMFSGSIGKTYVSAVLLQLAEEGRVDLDDPISTWFGQDDWFDRLPNARTITLRMLLNHTTGLPRYIFTPQLQAAVKAHPQRVWEPQELIAFVLDAEPLFAAGDGWAYSDTNYILVGMIIERVTGQTYYDELERRLLKPLRLRDTTPADRPKLRGLISGYTSEGNIFGLPPEVAIDGRYAMNPQLEWTGGGLIETSADLARWAWLLYGHDVLSAETKRQLRSGIPMGDAPDRQYGLGVMMRSSEELGDVLGHAGWIPGYVSMMACYPNSKVSVAVQVNSDIGVNAAALEELLDSIAASVAP